MTGKLTADAAVERALTFNHQLRAKALEAALAEARVRIEAGAMLPDVVAESHYFGRDERPYSRSSGSKAYAPSSDLTSVTRSIALSWNLLDFGLTMLRTRQAIDKASREQEDVRRIASRITEETRTAFWRTAALQMLVPELSKIDKAVDQSLVLSRKAAADPLLDPVDQINFQRDTLNMRREINDIFAQVAGAGFQLKTLIAVPLGTSVKLDARRNPRALRLPTGSAENDVARALRQRPEIRQHMYDLRITATDVDAALLNLLPGAELSRTFSSDSSSFLLDGNWVSWGAKIAGNLIEFARLPAKLDSLEAQRSVQRQSALVTAAAIAMQVHVARAQVAVQLRAYRNADQFSKAQRELLHQVRNSVEIGKLAEQALAQERTATLLADVRAIIAYGDLHSAIAAYETALGEDRDIPPQPIVNAVHAQFDSAVQPAKPEH